MACCGSGGIRSSRGLLSFSPPSPFAGQCCMLIRKWVRAPSSTIVGAPHTHPVPQRPRTAGTRPTSHCHQGKPFRLLRRAPRMWWARASGMGHSFHLARQTAWGWAPMPPISIPRLIGSAAHGQGPYRPLRVVRLQKTPPARRLACFALGHMGVFIGGQTCDVGVPCPYN